ncbi:hypothetical protein K2173_011312 [Erythroxylum novogranatense]|uniref:RNase H type-1 domain-containing protein n=1 Tax=Erythroxylum novogranatense TaxID=1862640 RepID=A0AAV8S9E4_9ROSI|nr:hypothetical protein K2173_011312 [Erythroxylum novogranatense]
MLTGNVQTDSDCLLLVDRILDLLKRFNNMEITHICKEGNFVADSLSHLTFDFPHDFHVLEQVSPKIDSIRCCSTKLSGLSIIGMLLLFSFSSFSRVLSLKNPRSAVCKPAIMTSADLFDAYGDCIIESLDPWYIILVQLLKSSQDKRFVCEAARMTTGISPNLLLPKLQPHLKNKNPRIQAKASMCFCHSVLYLGVESMNSYGIDKLIQVAAPQLSDQIPESREAAWTLLLKLQTIYKKSHELTLPMSDNRELSSWEHLC